MKFNLRILLYGFVIQAGLAFCHAHENTLVHPAISTNAAIASSGLTHFLAENFNYADLNGANLSFSDPAVEQTSKSPIGWILDGSRCEDVPWWRGINHFYDPTKKPAIGLTDGVTLGYKHNSFVWATVETNATYRGILSEQRSYGWTAARAYELNALTNISSIGRQTNLAGMLFYLGHVIHLNQDLSVPAHVRNDNHGVAADNWVFESLVMWTENFGAAQCIDNPRWFTNHPSHSGWSW